MNNPVRSERFPKPALSLDDFKDDQPFVPAGRAGKIEGTKDLIAGVELIPLRHNTDKRGELVELSIFDQEREPLVHVYQVFAAPGSVRAWVYHKRQFDRLAFTMGEFEVVLFDLRPDSDTYLMLNVFHLGTTNSAVLRIPPFVAHGVKNFGKEWASFVNMPTRQYDPAHPDKSRIAKDDPRIPYTFDER